MTWINLVIKKYFQCLQFHNVIKYTISNNEACQSKPNFRWKQIKITPKPFKLLNWSKKKLLPNKQDVWKKIFFSFPPTAEMHRFFWLTNSNAYMNLLNCFTQLLRCQQTNLMDYYIKKSHPIWEHAWNQAYVLYKYLCLTVSLPQSAISYVFWENSCATIVVRIMNLIGIRRFFCNSLTWIFVVAIKMQRPLKQLWYYKNCSPKLFSEKKENECLDL